MSSPAHSRAIDERAKIMWMRTILILTIMLGLGTDTVSAKSHHGRRHHLQAAVEPVIAPYTGPTLVLHPASNIACNTVYRSTRALPCDQPVWVYGRPCEIDLGLGRYRSCD
jgi:hypothetical protein